MTVEAVELRPFSLDLEQPLDTAGGQIDSRSGWILRIETSKAVGFGEATPLSGWTEPAEACRASLQRAVEGVERAGLPEFDPAAPSVPTGESTVPDPNRGTDDHPAFAAVEGAPAARHALTLALSDLQARQQEAPLYRTVHGESGGVPTRAVRRVPVNATLGDGSAAETARAAERAVSDGHDCLKVKVGVRSVEEDLARLRAVAAAVPAATLRADANAAWSQETAREAVAAIESAGLGLEYLEQPLAPGDLSGHAGLRGSFSVPIAVDESVGERGVEAVLRADAADAVVCKPQPLGGIDVALSAVRSARNEGVTAVVSNTVDAVVARTAAVHVAAAMDDPPACGLATAGLLAEDLGPDPAVVSGGSIAVPQSPGIARPARGWAS